MVFQTGMEGYDFQLPPPDFEKEQDHQFWWDSVVKQNFVAGVDKMFGGVVHEQNYNISELAISR